MKFNRCGGSRGNQPLWKRAFRDWFLLSRTGSPHLLALGFAFLFCSPSFAGSLRAGAARIDITPSQPVTLAGYESRKELSRGVHDPLSARALALEQEGQK